MIARIARKELTELFRDSRITWTGVLVLILSLTSLVAGYQHQQEVAVERAAGEHASYHHWLSQGEVNPHSAAHFGMYVFKPTPPLSLLDPGIHPYTGVVLQLEAHWQHHSSFRPAQDATGLQRFGYFSTAWALQALVPLLIIVLAFNAISSERERGTLRQLMSLGVSPSRLMWGKALSIGIILGLLLLPVALVLLIILLFGTGAGGAGDALLRWFAIFSAYGLYLGIFLFLALAVSAWSSSSRMALLLLLAVWIVNVMVAPRAGDELARAFYPTPSQFAFQNAFNSDLGAAWERLLNDYGGARWSDIPRGEFGNSLLRGAAYETEVTDRHFGGLWSTFEDQRRVQQWASLLAPLLAIRAVSAGLAGTDLAHQRAFIDATERYRREFERKMNADIAAHAGDLGYNYRAGPELWAQVGPFEYESPAVGWVFRHVWPSFMILGMAFAVALGLALGAARRLQG